MMPGATPGKKLDLSKLTDEEAKHVWKVVQRDFDLRKKEEDRLGDLKTKIEKEDTKRELLGKETGLAESHCIRCLQPFKFLVNSKRQCLDCQLYICKSCSRYNKKEQGWVCDPCHMTRVLKIGTLEWYHENVRARFKRFGSAKVMRSLFKRLSGEDSSSQTDLREPYEYDTQSMPDTHDGYEEHSLYVTDDHQDRAMKKTKRLLTVHPYDFHLDSEYTSDSRRQSYQVHEERHKEQEPDFNNEVRLHPYHRMSLGSAPRHDDIAYPESRASQTHSSSRLSYSSCGSSSAGGPHHSGGYLPGPEDSEEEEYGCHPYTLYRSHQRLRNHASQESLTSVASTSQIIELHRRMSAIEMLLNRLEQVASPAEQAERDHQAPQNPASSIPPPKWEEAKLEEQQLRQRLEEMTGNISDPGLTSDEDESKRPDSPKETPSCRSPAGEPNHSRNSSRSGFSAATQDETLYRKAEFPKAYCSTESLEVKECPIEDSAKGDFRGSTALLFELEGKVAQAAAGIQNSQSEVSYIENRIAALSAAGMSVDEGRRKSAIPIHTGRLSHGFPTRQVDMFKRNSIYRGSLTQRNPVVKPKTRATCAKPVMAQDP
ncbi:melanophilin [Lampris incognitus]|uniref:melanophilin n=1 Tax=Lampris incognitus TaxID=2546036 RepID=UPI0024B49942|nr:melanophilin [Lampris incognitus]